MKCAECHRLTKLFESAVLAEAKADKITASAEINSAKAEFVAHYAIHRTRTSVAQADHPRKKALSNPHSVRVPIDRG